MQSLKAFTMMELIMVVVIVGMIALFAIPNYNNAVSKSYQRTAKNNLLIMYSAQSILRTGGTAYPACADVAACNTALTLSVIPNGVNYSCTKTTDTFDCRASRTDGSFTLKVTNANAVVCCQSGTCDANIAPGC